MVSFDLNWNGLSFNSCAKLRKFFCPTYSDLIELIRLFKLSGRVFNLPPKIRLRKLADEENPASSGC